ncbi:MAG: hypothetical protein DME87_13980 [Verrucomicrobia bacterium]|nr:MAG: hypothetical protein DME87_13980 [Verrucomicrobiota bacterium]
MSDDPGKSGRQSRGCAGRSDTSYPSAACCDNLSAQSPPSRLIHRLDRVSPHQMVGYLAITGLELALLLNFKSARLEWKRVVRQYESESDVPDLRA